MFAVNDKYRKLYSGPYFSFGEWIFYSFIAEKAVEASEVIGIKIKYSADDLIRTIAPSGVAVLFFELIPTLFAIRCHSEVLTM